MNIFVLDQNPVKAAIYQCDKHVVKMILETAQMLSTVISDYGVDLGYKPTHRKHPCTLWAGRSRENFEWLVKHGMALSDEYTSRYGKIHKSRAIIEAAKGHTMKLPVKGLTPFAQAMPEKFKRPCAVQAYKSFYLGEKMSFATWKRNKPNWVP